MNNKPSLVSILLPLIENARQRPLQNRMKSMTNPLMPQGVPPANPGPPPGGNIMQQFQGQRGALQQRISSRLAAFRSMGRGLIPQNIQQEDTEKQKLRQEIAALKKEKAETEALKKAKEEKETESFKSEGIKIF